MPLVSVITPAFCAERFLPETLASIRAQSLRDWECLVVDDASTDRTAEIAAAAAAEDPRIHLIRQTANRGVAAARNAALRAATGRYIAFLDADDLWLPGKLERQIAFMRATGATLSYTAFRRIDETGTRVGRLITVPPAMTWRRLLKNTKIHTLTVVVDRERTGPFAMVERRRDDIILWLTLLRHGATARGLNEDLARYRVVKGSLSSSHLRAAGWMWRAYREEIGLGRLDAFWCLCHYGARAFWKRLSF
ncbi:MAG TPA: glycosyltransferase family 2 protein [Kiloniellales bacterium]|nr:glycosyltransferase family 2 protein [Kiloniellales bacterium]